MLVLCAPRQPGLGLARHLTAASASQRAPGQLELAFGTEGAPKPTSCLPPCPWKGLQEPKKVPEPAKPQRQCFHGVQQHSWSPPPKKTIFMKMGGLGRCQDETTPSMQRPVSFQAYAPMSSCLEFQTPMASSGKGITISKGMKREPNSGWRLTIDG